MLNSYIKNSPSTSTLGQSKLHMLITFQSSRNLMDFEVRLFFSTAVSKVNFEPEESGRFRSISNSQTVEGDKTNVCPLYN